MPMIDSPPPILDTMVIDGLEGCLREGFPSTNSLLSSINIIYLSPAFFLGLSVKELSSQLVIIGLMLRVGDGRPLLID